MKTNTGHGFFLYILLSAVLSSLVTTSLLAATWTYTGKTGAENWADLSPQYERCREGDNQSPISIQSPYVSQVSNKKTLSLVYTKTEFQLKIIAINHPNSQNKQNKLPGFSEIAPLKNSIHRIHLYPKTKQYLIYQSEQYALTHITLKTPAAHTILAYRPKLAFHFHHQADSGKELVYILFGVPSKTALPVVQSFMTRLSKMPRTLSVNFSLLQPEFTQTYTYEGSLLTPPCDEDITYLISNQAIEVTEKDLETLQKLDPAHGQTRPIQELGNRKVLIW